MQSKLGIMAISLVYCSVFNTIRNYLCAGCPLNALRIVFVATNKNPNLFLADPSFVYRCQNLAMALQAIGHQVQLTHISKLNFWSKIDILVIHRPKGDFLTKLQIQILRHKGCKIIADFDDLVFVPEFAYASPGVINHLVSLKQTETNFQLHYKGLQICDGCIVSVVPLQQKVAEHFNLPVLVIPNTVHLNWRALNKSPDKLKSPKLTYFPGTRSHDRDFATIVPILEQLLDEEPELQLMITGVLSTDLKCRPHQITCYPKQSFDNYAKHVASSWLNLAPLEETVFNTHKSALKVIEAAWFNTPTLASPIPDMQRLENAGAILMNSPNDWYNSIKSMLNNESDWSAQPNLRNKILAAGDLGLFAQRFLQFVATL